MTASSLRLPATWLLACLAASCLATGFLATGCLGLRPAPTPMPSVALIEQTPPAPCVAVLLPGVLDGPRSFARRDFHTLAAERAPGLDVVAANAHLGYYRKRSVLVRLENDIIGPRAADGQRVWLVGISLGGIGSLLYAREHDVEGLVVLAPFLGDEELIDSIAAAGGPLAWQPPQTSPPLDEDPGAKVWPWLVSWHEARSSHPSDAADGPPRIVLGYGLDDDFALAGEQLATLLDPADTFTRPGGHDWPTWRQLWIDVLDSGVFDGCAPEQGS